MNINDEGTSNAAYWHERAMKAEARLALVENDLRNATACWHAACHDIAVRDERLAEAETALRIIAEQDWRYDELKARLAEAEHLILRMAGEDYQRARFYVEKYDLTGERAAVSASDALP